MLIRFVCKLNFHRTIVCLIGLLFCASNSIAQEATAVPPRVSRVQMKLVVDGEVVDVIEKGDLLTVVEERDESFVVRTFNGRKGVVSKVNAVAIAESAEIYTELIDAAPKDGRLYTLRGGAFWEQGKKAEALADFDRAIELGYDKPHAFVSRALFNAAIGDFDKAIADYSVAVTKEPEVVSHLVNRAAVLMSMAKFEEAINDYDAAIKLDEKNGSLFQQRAVAKKAMGDLQGSIADFDQSLKLDPKSIASLMGRGFVHFQTGDHKAAVEDFSKVVEMNPTAAVAMNNRGYNLQQLGDESKALADFDEAIKLAPTYGLAHQNRAWLLLSAKDESLRNFDEALVSAKQACELSEFKNAGDMAALAAAQAANGAFELAIGWQEKVIELVTDDQKPFARAVLRLYQDQKPYDAKTALQIVEKEAAAK